MVLEPLAAVARVVEVPSRRVQDFAFGAVTLVLILETYGSLKVEKGVVFQMYRKMKTRL